MNSRYLTNAALILAGAFLVVASQAFGALSFEWIMLGIGALAVLTTGAVLSRSRGRTQRSLDGTIGVLGAWTIVASLVFAGSTVIWLGFASGVALFALGLLGLTLHELSTERVVHSIEVQTAMSEPELAGIS
jgi:drug/metabolite transporter (DMT)-like permease